MEQFGNIFLNTATLRFMARLTLKKHRNDNDLYIENGWFDVCKVKEILARV